MTDSGSMLELPTWTWVCLSLGALATVFAILHILACAVRDDTTMHDLRVRVATLRKQRLEHQENLARQARTESASPVEVGEAPEQPTRRAA
jgi:hypothetical protein